MKLYGGVVRLVLVIAVGWFGYWGYQYYVISEDLARNEARIAKAPLTRERAQAAKIEPGTPPISEAEIQAFLEDDMQSREWAMAAVDELGTEKQNVLEKLALYPLLMLFGTFMTTLLGLFVWRGFFPKKPNAEVTG